MSRDEQSFAEAACRMRHGCRHILWGNIITGVAEVGVFQECLSTHLTSGSSSGAAEQVDPTEPSDGNFQNLVLEQQKVLPLEQQLPSKSAIKTEVEFSFTEVEVEIPPDQNPLSTDTVDIEYGIYSEEVTKVEPVSKEGHGPDNDCALPVVVASASGPSIPATSAMKSHRKKREGTAGTRKFGPCQFCGKKFQRSNHLKHHVYTHTGQRPYKCLLCPMAFREPVHLKNHLLTHTGKKPFICPKCKTGFARKENLKKHKKTHNKEQRFNHT